MDSRLKRFITDKEDQYFDRKNARIKPKDIIRHIVAFSNADGGQLVIGVDDDGTLSGFTFQGAHSPDEYILAISSMTKPNPVFRTEKIAINNTEGREDIVLVIEVEPRYLQTFSDPCQIPT